MTDAEQPQNQLDGPGGRIASGQSRACSNTAPGPLADLARHMAPRIAKMAADWCGPDAHDGAQEVQRELTRSWPAFRGEAAATTWAHRIAIRTLARFAERRRKYERREAAESQLDLRLDDAAVASFASNPLAAVTAAERRRRVHDAIDSLSPALRAVLVLRGIEGLNYREIADTLELPIGTVKSRIAAATIHLAERLQDLQDER